MHNCWALCRSRQQYAQQLKTHPANRLGPWNSALGSLSHLEAEPQHCGTAWTQTSPHAHHSFSSNSSFICRPPSLVFPETKQTAEFQLILPCRRHAQGALARTYELGEAGQHALVRQEQVVGVAQLALGLEGLVLGLELGQAHHLLDARLLLLGQALLGILVALSCNAVCDQVPRRG